MNNEQSDIEQLETIDDLLAKAELHARRLTDPAAKRGMIAKIAKARCMASKRIMDARAADLNTHPDSQRSEP